MNSTKTKKNYVRKGMKRYVARRARYVPMGRYKLTNDITRCQVESYDQIQFNAGATAPIFTTASNYINLYNIIVNSPTWTDQQPIWGRFKITGISVRISPSAGLTAIDTAFSVGAPTLSVAFYPQLLSSSLGTSPSYNDHKIFCDPASTIPQTRYYKFPDGFFEGSGGVGLGIWNSTNALSSLFGQFSVSTNQPGTAGSLIQMFNVKFTVYMLFSDKNR